MWPSAYSSGTPKLTWNSSASALGWASTGRPASSVAQPADVDEPLVVAELVDRVRRRRPPTRRARPRGSGVEARVARGASRAGRRRRRPCVVDHDRPAGGSRPSRRAVARSRPGRRRRATRSGRRARPGRDRRGRLGAEAPAVVGGDRTDVEDGAVGVVEGGAEGRCVDRRGASGHVCAPSGGGHQKTPAVAGVVGGVRANRVSGPRPDTPPALHGSTATRTRAHESKMAHRWRRMRDRAAPRQSRGWVSERLTPGCGAAPSSDLDLLPGDERRLGDHQAEDGRVVGELALARPSRSSTS